MCIFVVFAAISSSFHAHVDRFQNKASRTVRLCSTAHAHTHKIYLYKTSCNELKMMTTQCEAQHKRAEYRKKRTNLLQCVWLFPDNIRPRHWPHLMCSHRSHTFALISCCEMYISFCPIYLKIAPKKSFYFITMLCNPNW